MISSCKAWRRCENSLFFPVFLYEGRSFTKTGLDKHIHSTRERAICFLQLTILERWQLSRGRSAAAFAQVACKQHGYARATVVTNCRSLLGLGLDTIPDDDTAWWDAHHSGSNKHRLFRALCPELKSSTTSCAERTVFDAILIGIIYQDRLGTNATTTDKTMGFSLAANTMCPWNSLEVHTASTDTPRFDQLDWMQFNEKVRRLNTSSGANMVLFLFPLLSLWKR